MTCLGKFPRRDFPVNRPLAPDPKKNGPAYQADPEWSSSKTLI
ncbi:Uncharacterized protein ChrSV_0644 [Chromobacterium vaccinii]|nr:Uncharacterized protein ChrSW_0644 [Chromobacterium vaccinii]QND88103.1 Uncharacterized protein ChrSV_0644 [Chromobacterium vaccinii]